MSTEKELQAEATLAAEPAGTSRRVFVGTAVAAVGCGYAGLIGYPVYRYLASPIEKAALASQVREVKLSNAQTPGRGTAMMFMFGQAPALLIHLPNGDWSALSAVCTHLNCTVKYEPDQHRLFCPCHGGVYDPSTGANLSGPPPRPLEKYTVVVGKESITVSKG